MDINAELEFWINRVSVLEEENKRLLEENENLKQMVAYQINNTRMV